MKVYNEDKTQILDSYDLELGYLKDDVIETHIDAEIVHHEAVEGVEEQGHYELIREYPNGGKTYDWIVDVAGVKPQEAYDEVVKEAYVDRESIQIYIPYTAEELAKRKAISLRSQLESYLSDTDYAIIKCHELGLDVNSEYPSLLEKRQQARDRINQIDRDYPDLKAKLSYPL